MFQVKLHLSELGKREDKFVLRCRVDGEGMTKKNRISVKGGGNKLLTK